jgi:hydroxymethylpyrimidine/phosphomethylpyrimidine kinase
LAARSAHVKGILWHQGESDCKDASLETYVERFKVMISAMRKQLGNENLPVILGELSVDIPKNPRWKITPEHIEKMKILASRADILTPNLTEACLLTDTPYVEEPWSDEALKELLCKLSALCPGRIVITGLHRDHLLVNAIWENEQFSTYSVPVAGKSRSGTGDLFASIVSADILRGADLFSAVKKAANFIALCIRGAEELNIPAKEGVPFELYLHCLQ